MSLARKLRECLAWVGDNGGSLVFEGGGTVALFDEDGETRAQVDGFTIERGADVLEELLQEANEPPIAVPTIPIVQHVTYFGLGESRFAWDERRTLSFTPDRELLPQQLRIPAGAAHYLIHQVRFGGQPLLTNEDGIPAAFFSEVSTAPQILFPSIGPGMPAEFDVRAPSCPKAPHPFSGGLFGYAKEQSK